MSKKVIWILNQTAGTLDSGWGERHYFLAKKWKEKGYKTFIFSGSYNHLFINQPITSAKKLTIESVEEDITFCWVKTPKYKDSGFAKFWSNIVYTVRLFFLNLSSLPRPNHIIVSSMPIFPIITGIVFKRRYQAKKLIIEIRDLWPLTPIHLKNYAENHPLVLILSWFEKLAYRKSDFIVSLLPNAYKHIDKISKEPNKFHYIPNGIDEQLIQQEKLSPSVLELIPKNKFIVGYAGTLGFANAMHDFVKASKLMKKNQQIHFLIVGNGIVKKELEEIVDKDQSNITFIPKIPKAQVQHMLSHFDICYLSRFSSPLYKYGVSYNKYFDYMLAQKPILESSEFINDQVEESGCGLIVQPENAEAIEMGIIQLFKTSEQERQKLGMKGYEYVKKYHNFEYLSNLYIKLFK